MALATVNFFSQALSHTTTFNIVIPTDKVLPTGTVAPEKDPCKTLYLLHGYLGNYTDWVTGTRVQALANDHNLCVVMPSGDNKFYCDSELTGDYYGRFIGEELVDFTRRTFCLSEKREDTFIGGLSMGGFGAIVNGLRHPETFSRIVAFSSALFRDRVLDASIDLMTCRQFMTVFGLKRMEDYIGSEDDNEAMAEKVAGSGKERPAFYLACGEQDPLLAPNAAFRDKLLSLGYDVTWESWAGAHEWHFWDTAIEKAIGWLPLDETAQGKSSGNT